MALGLACASVGGVYEGEGENERRACGQRERRGGREGGHGTTRIITCVSIDPEPSRAVFQIKSKCLPAEGDEFTCLQLRG